MKMESQQSDREVLAGLVERVTYQNSQNGFCVIRVKARGHRELITVVGHAAAISAGEWITAAGDWVNDRTHGQQFKARFLKTSAPTSVEGIEKYLASGMIRGIGPVYAKKLLRAFGDKVFDVIEAEPNRLREVDGIGPVRAGRDATKPEPGHKIYPYLLRGMEITRPNQVWAMDITYIPMARGFVYLAVVLDWFSRRVLSWRLSITLEAAFCVETLEDALARHGKPDIFNTDQGSQFTGAAFTGALIKNGIAISMDGKGAWRDNVFVERLWRSVKYEEVYLRAYDSVSDARASIGRYLDFYNGRRPNSSLDGMTPDQAYFTPRPLRLAA